jgi:NAD(P)-dependent dehydrogenase (short-subunit alcohol dehydrogenase family)
MSPRWAVVTGSSSGLGLAMTAHLLEQGWNVAGGSRSGTDLEHDNFYDMELDVTDEKSVAEFYRTLKTLTSQVHLFVQNAGVCEMATVDATSAESFERHLATNTLGAFYMLKGFAPFLAKDETHVVSVLSTAAKHGYASAAAYNTSQFGLRGLLETLQREWRPLGVRFTPLYPGAVETPLWQDLGKEFARQRMLSVKDFLYVFDFVLHAPAHLRLADLTFIHREGFLE